MCKPKNQASDTIIIQLNSLMLRQGTILNANTYVEKGYGGLRSNQKVGGDGGCRVTLKDMPISPCLNTSPKVLKLLVYHPTELIMPLLDKVTKSGILSFHMGRLAPLE